MAASSSQLRRRWKHEPGSTIQRTIQEWCIAGSKEAKSTDALLRLLDGLEFCEEVKGGRDLRGISLHGGLREFDFKGFEFCYASLHLSLVLCELTRANFDEVTATQQISGVLEGATFRRAKLKGVSFLNARALAAIFDDSDLTGASFENANLAGSSFRRVRCFRTNFFAANLVGCDFREARMTEAVFQNASVDSTTDIRGASLKGIFDAERLDFSGRLIGSAADFSVAIRDEKTVYEPAGPPAHRPVPPPEIDIKLSNPRIVRRKREH